MDQFVAANKLLSPFHLLGVTHILKILFSYLKKNHGSKWEVKPPSPPKRGLTIRAPPSPEQNHNYTTGSESYYRFFSLFMSKNNLLDMTPVTRRRTRIKTQSSLQTIFLNMGQTRWTAAMWIRLDSRTKPIANNE